MVTVRLWCACLLLVAVLPLRAWAADDGHAFAEDQNRLAAAYLGAGSPIAALSPLLNVLRTPGIQGTDDEYKAKLNLARAYLAVGLYGSAKRLLLNLATAPAPWRAAALATRIELHMIRGETSLMLADLQEYKSTVSGPVSADLVFKVAKAAFASRDTDASGALFQELSAADPRPEARYFLGVSRLLRHDLEGAYASFQSLHKTIDRERYPEFYDYVQLAIGRIYYENGSYPQAEVFYSAIPESSPAYDRALYETSWVYLAQGDVTAATGNLLQLAIERPFSPLVPRAQVLYGYLLLRRGEFTSAEASFIRYIAHYAALTDRIADLEAIPESEEVYESLFGQADHAIASGQSLTVELLAWLQRNPKLTRARRLVTSLQTAEDELADTARTLRDVQALSEAGQGAFGMSSAMGERSRHMEALEDQIRILEDKIENKVVPLGERLAGQRGVAFKGLQRQLRDIRAVRGDLLRQEKRSMDKRYELVSLLQYADASQWGIWLDGTLAKRPATEPVALQRGEMNTLFERLDRTDERLAKAHRRVQRLENEILNTRLNLLRNEIPFRKLSEVPGQQAELNRLHTDWIRFNEQQALAQREIATATRGKIDAFIANIRLLRQQLIEYSNSGVRLRGEVARTELRLIEKEIGSLLVHARLGNADVAWDARHYIQQRTRGITAREQADMENLQNFYRSLDTTALAPRPETPGTVTGSTAQKVRELAGRAETYRANLARVSAMLSAQRQASAQLVSRLKQEGHHDDAVGRVDAAGLLLQQSPEASGYRLAGMVVYLDGRRIANQNRGQSVLLDSYLQPGMHQMDAAFTYLGVDNQAIRLQGTYYFTLERAQGYRMVILPELTSASKNLRFSLQAEQNR